MAPPQPLLALQEKKEEDSISNFDTHLQDNAPPELDDVHLLNKQFET
jgi:hypothetical protein